MSADLCRCRGRPPLAEQPQQQLIRQRSHLARAPHPTDSVLPAQSVRSVLTSNLSLPEHDEYWKDWVGIVRAVAAVTHKNLKGIDESYLEIVYADAGTNPSSY